MAYGSNLQAKIYNVHSLIGCHNSLVTAVTFYGLDDVSFIPNKGHDIQTKPALLPAFHPTGNRGFYPVSEVAGALS